MSSVSVGKWRQAERALKTAIETANQLGDNRRRAESMSTLGNTMSFQGRFAESREIGLQITQWGEQRGIAQEQAWGLCLQLEAILAETSQSGDRIAGMAETLEKVLAPIRLAAIESSEPISFGPGGFWRRPNGGSDKRRLHFSP